MTAPQRFLSLWFPYLATERLLRRGFGGTSRADRSLGAGGEAAPAAPPPAPGRHPRRQGWRGDAPQPGAAPAPGPLVVTVARAANAERLVAVGAAARQAGLRPGMGLADARALHPGLAAAPADPAAEAELLRIMAAWSRRWTPLVALDGEDGLMLDVTGCAHLFGGEEALLGTAEQAFQAQGFTVLGALAGSPALAAALARHLREPAGGGCILGAAAQWSAAERRMVAQLPVAALRPGASVEAGLTAAGLRRLGDLALRPRAPLTARFGARLLQTLDEILGLGPPSPIRPLLPAPLYVVERRFQDPIARDGDILATLHRLAVDLVALTDRHGESPRRLECTLFRTDGAAPRLEVGLSPASASPAAILGLFRERLAGLADEVDPGFGFDVVRLSALAAAPAAAVQTDLAQESRDEPVALLVDRLGARLGRARITRLAPCDSHVPERAVLARPAAGPASPWQAAAPPAPRPLRLFARPEPVETIAAVPDGPPLRFRWRRHRHEVARSEGPERIAAEWWRDPAPTRDYFQVETREGQRFWLYRDGLFGSESDHPRWFLHGVFA